MDFRFVQSIWTAECFVNKAQFNGEFAKTLLLKEAAANCIRSDSRCNRKLYVTIT